MEQLTREEAIEMAESKWWIGKSHQEIAEYQLQQECLCIDFPIFHQAVEESLGRSVFTHEFANQQALLLEFVAKQNAQCPS